MYNKPIKEIINELFRPCTNNTSLHWKKNHYRNKAGERVLVHMVGNIEFVRFSYDGEPVNIKLSKILNYFKTGKFALHREFVKGASLPLTVMERTIRDVKQMTLKKYLSEFYSVDSSGYVHMTESHPERHKYKDSKLSGRALNRLGEPLTMLYTIRFQNRLYEVTNHQVRACISGDNTGDIRLKCNPRKTREEMNAVAMNAAFSVNYNAWNGGI
ncbi:hypothetical protein [Lelliottia wanjuensis]|uniref:hypothetical protein n=1 Tax=Lelliottia wanjuensis TaxID=3050585 RepID=UPI00254DECC9|nr:hypothetical protein [Lelliottia sp. V86_10]MDK9585878.1 hypothetical protein [Lelliottia sp. V86_10]